MVWFTTTTHAGHHPLRFIYPLLLHLLLVVAASASPSTATFFSYDGFNTASQSQIRCFQGASFVHSSIQLTATDALQGMGRCLYSLPVQFLQGSTPISFSSQFIFLIEPGPEGNVDGLAFLISPSLGAVENSSQGYLGVFNSQTDGNTSTHTLAIEFDTYLNPEFDDPNENHVGIDVNSIFSWTTMPAAYRTSSSPTIQSAADGYSVQMKGNTIQAWIDYDGTTNQLNISISRVLGRKPNYPLISNSSLNLSSLFHEQMYVGFAAASGPLKNVFYYVYAWSFSNNGSAANDVFLPEDEGGNGNRKKTIVLAIVLTIVVLALVAVVTFYICYRRWQNIRAQQLRKDRQWELSLAEQLPQKFTYSELSKATQSFSKKNCLGMGGFGEVFQGVLPSTGLEVAVKRISKESKQGVKEFVSEVTTIGRLRHRNLVPLLGWCQDRGFMLVYELMPKGSLDKLLFDCEEKLLWNQRLHILKGVAAALLYLHEECEQKIVHRDIKASNVMLDGQMNARLGDFGLARLYGHDVAPGTTNVAGTWGYMAPESFFTRRATEKTDVFSFGALTLEVATGRKMGDVRESESCSMIEWLWKLKKDGRLEEAADSVGDTNQEDYEMVKVVLDLGLLCCYPDPESRPSMRRIVQVLDGDAPPLAMPALSASPFLFSSMALATTPQESTSSSHDHDAASFDSDSELLQNASSSSYTEDYNRHSQLKANEAKIIEVLGVEEG